METQNVTELRARRTKKAKAKPIVHPTSYELIKATVTVTLSPYLKEPSHAPAVVQKLEDAIVALTVQKASTFLASQIKGLFGKN